MLEVNNIEVVYNSVILVLRGISLKIEPGQAVTIMGPNGAGKSTALKAISGILHGELGEVTRGSIKWNGETIHTLPAEEIVRKGVFQVIEGRPLFRHLTVEENLKVGSLVYNGGREAKTTLNESMNIFQSLRICAVGQVGICLVGNNKCWSLDAPLWDTLN